METVIHYIFLELCKTYNALDRDRCLDTLAGNGGGPRMLRILQKYWDRLQMAAKAGGHYGPVFQSHHRVTQEEPLSPTIFNVVVDAIIRHWVTVVGGPQEGNKKGLGKSIHTLAALFHASDGLVTYPESTHIQGAFNVLTGLFDQVGLQTNGGKMVSMACRPCHTYHTWSTEDYTRKVTGRGLSYKERINQRVHCPECRFNLAAGSLAAHLK